MLNNIAGSRTSSRFNIIPSKLHSVTDLGMKKAFSQANVRIPDDRLNDAHRPRFGRCFNAWNTCGVASVGRADE